MTDSEGSASSSPSSSPTSSQASRSNSIQSLDDEESKKKSSTPAKEESSLAKDGSVSEKARPRDEGPTISRKGSSVSPREEQQAISTKDSFSLSSKGSSVSPREEQQAISPKESTSLSRKESSSSFRKEASSSFRKGSYSVLLEKKASMTPREEEAVKTEGAFSLEKENIPSVDNQPPSRKGSSSSLRKSSSSLSCKESASLSRKDSSSSLRKDASLEKKASTASLGEKKGSTELNSARSTASHHPAPTGQEEQIRKSQSSSSQQFFASKSHSRTSLKELPQEKSLSAEKSLSSEKSGSSATEGVAPPSSPCPDDDIISERSWMLPGQVKPGGKDRWNRQVGDEGHEEDLDVKQVEESRRKSIMHAHVRKNEKGKTRSSFSVAGEGGESEISRVEESWRGDDSMMQWSKASKSPPDTYRLQENEDGHNTDLNFQATHFQIGDDDADDVPNTYRSEKSKKPQIHLVIKNDEDTIETLRKNREEQKYKFLQKLRKHPSQEFEGEIGGINNHVCDKLRVVSFATGKVFETTDVEEHRIAIKNQKKYIPLDCLELYIEAVFQDMETMRKHHQHVVSELEWNFKIIDEKMRANFERKLEEARQKSFHKLETLQKTLIDYAKTISSINEENTHLRTKFDEKVKDYKHQMQDALTQVDGKWKTKNRKIEEDYNIQKEVMEYRNEKNEFVIEILISKTRTIVERLKEFTVLAMFPFSENLDEINEPQAFISRLELVVDGLRSLIYGNVQEKVSLYLEGLFERLHWENSKKKLSENFNSEKLKRERAENEVMSLNNMLMNTGKDEAEILSKIKEYEGQIFDLKKEIEAKKVVIDETKGEIDRMKKARTSVVGVQNFARGAIRSSLVGSTAHDDGNANDVALESTGSNVRGMRESMMNQGSAISSGDGDSLDTELLKIKLNQMMQENEMLQTKLKMLSPDAEGRKGDENAMMEELNKQMDKLKSLQDENTKLRQENAKASQASKDTNARAVGRGGDPKQVEKLQQQNKQLQQELMKAKKNGGGNPDSDKQVRELEMKIKEMDLEKRKEAKEFEKQLASATKGSAQEARKNEALVVKLSEKTQKQEQEMESLNVELKVERRDKEIAKKELEDLKSRVGDFDAVMTEVQELRTMTKQLNTQNKELDEGYKKEKSLRKKYYNEIEDMKGKIRVYCRTRPMAKYEIEKQCHPVVNFLDEYSILVNSNKGPREFTFDRCFQPDCTQEEVFEDTQRLIQSVVDGFNVCIFAYGQTGSGKTFTIQGGGGKKGIAPRAIDNLFDLLEGLEEGKYSFEVQCYMLELYNNQLLDLLIPQEKKANPPPLDIKKDANGFVKIINATMKQVENREKLYQFFTLGLDTRHVSSTNMNSESSRSHLIFSCIVQIDDLVAKKRITGKLSVIDLAGSERVSKSGVTKERLAEAREINKSLTALGDVISALSSGESFIPYRNHKLTQLMSDSLGGSAKTLMFVNISPADYNVDETITALMYAQRVKMITNDASKQVESQEMAKLKKKVADLRKVVKKLKDGEEIDITKVLDDGEEAEAPAPEAAAPADQGDDEGNFDEPEDITFDA